MFTDKLTKIDNKPSTAKFLLVEVSRIELQESLLNGLYDVCKVYQRPYVN